MTVEILRSATSRARLAALAEAQFGDMVKAVVDVRRRVMAVGGELHSDEEAALIEAGRSVEDGALRDRIREIVTGLVKDDPPG